MSEVAAVQKICEVVAAVKGAAAEDEEAAFFVWAYGEDPCDCRGSGELCIDCDGTAGVICAGRVVIYG